MLVYQLKSYIVKKDHYLQAKIIFNFHKWSSFWPPVVLLLPRPL